MKKITTLLLVLICFSAAVNIIYADDPPRRNATKVDDVFSPYTADEWIVSPEEEPTEDEDVSNAAECDIYGVIACYDDEYLRVDIILNNSISYDWLTVYAIKLEYSSMSEYYTYHTDSDELIYEKEKKGKITETKVLTEEESNDFAGVSGSGYEEDDDVYFIISKKNHISGEKGNRYYLTCRFYSGFINNDDELNIADQTITA